MFYFTVFFQYICLNLQLKKMFADNVAVFQIEKYVSTSNLKYYFAVDTAYVGKKLGLLLFPYAHSVRRVFT